MDMGYDKSDAVRYKREEMIKEQNTYSQFYWSMAEEYIPIELHVVSNRMLVVFSISGIITELSDV